MTQFSEKSEPQLNYFLAQSFARKTCKGCAGRGIIVRDFGLLAHDEDGSYTLPIVKGHTQQQLAYCTCVKRHAEKMR